MEKERKKGTHDDGLKPRVKAKECMAAATRLTASLTFSSRPRAFLQQCASLSAVVQKCPTVNGPLQGPRRVQLHSVPRTSVE